MNNIAIIVSGTTCSGKTIISKRISEDLKLKLINEEYIRPFNLENLSKELKKHKSENIVIEHTDILNYFDEIKKYYQNIILIYLNISDKILIKNYNIRKDNKAVGDFINIDNIKLKKDIEKEIKNLKSEVIYLNISKMSDYDTEYTKLINIIKTSSIVK